MPPQAGSEDVQAVAVSAQLEGIDRACSSRVPVGIQAAIASDMRQSVAGDAEDLCEISPYVPSSGPIAHRRLHGGVEAGSQVEISRQRIQSRPAFQRWADAGEG